MQKRAANAARFGGDLWGAGSGDGDYWQRRHDVLHRLVQGGARFLFATTAAVRTARASLQLGELMDAFAGGPADVAVGDGVAHADIHGTYGNANANDCQLRTRAVPGGVIQLPSGLVKKASGRNTALPWANLGIGYGRVGWRPVRPRPCPCGGYRPRPDRRGAAGHPAGRSAGSPPAAQSGATRVRRPGA